MENSLYQFLDAYKSGQRLFQNLEFENGESLKGLHLRDSTFQNCWLAVDFTDADLTNCIFLNCNLKTSDFTRANLKNATIKECALEGTVFLGANTEGLVFENNYCFGLTLQRDDFTKFC